MIKEIPCKIGDSVYVIRNRCNGQKIEKGVVSEMFFVGEEMQLCVVVRHVMRGYWGKDIFDTYEKAEEHLNANR